jgi:hypothetical protein
MPHFERTTRFVAVGADFDPTVTGAEPYAAEGELAELLREHGPEAVIVYAPMGHGPLEELRSHTEHTGRDDIAKYYVTRYTSPITGRYIEIGWDN